MQPLRGTFSVLVLYDVAEQIDLDRLRALGGSQQPVRDPAFKHPAPEYVRFERPPVVEFPEPVCIVPGESFATRLRYFAYGVVSAELELPFESDWDDLIRLASRFVAEPEIEKHTLELVRTRVRQIEPALVQPYSSWLSEEYCIINVRGALDEDRLPLTAAAMLAKHGDDITRIVRGESVSLSKDERADALQGSLSYYPSDLLVVGWVAAFIYDNEAGAEPAIQLLEYANSQLLEFRHYDEVLTRILEDVYNSIERGGRAFSPLAHDPPGSQTKRGSARSYRSYGTHRQRTQICRRYVLCARLSHGRRARRRDRLPKPGGTQASHRGRSLSVDGE